LLIHQTRHTVNTKAKLHRFLNGALPENLTQSAQPNHQHIKTKQDFIEDAFRGLDMAPMALRLTPHILSRINWENPLDDPIRRQFLPVSSGLITDHPELTLDSLHEEDDSRESATLSGPQKISADFWQLFQDWCIVTPVERCF
jgi:lysine 2,3-aminomutase